MTEIDRIKIDPIDMTVLRRLHFETITRQNIIATLIENHAQDGNDAVLSSKAFRTYSDELVEATASLKSLKDRITTLYLPEKYQSENYIWNADFDTDEIVIIE